jgi:hypothetical protein
VSFPGVVYLRGDAGTKVLNGLYIDHLYNAAGYTLAISATGGCNVTIDDCAYLGMTTNPVIDGGSVNGRIRNFSTISALNLLVSNISTGSVSVDQIYTRNINIDPPSTVYISHPDLTINANLTTDEAEDPQPNNLNLLASSNVNIQCGNNPSAFSVNITGDTYVSRTFTASLGISTTNINLSTINGAPYVPGGGAGSWVSTAASALDMAGFNINNAGIISSLNVYANTAVIGTPSAFGNTFAYFGNNSLASNGGDYALLQENNGQTFLNAKLYQRLFLRNGNYDIMTLDDTQIQAFKPLSLNSNLFMNNRTIYNANELYNNNVDLLLTGIGRNITIQTVSAGNINITAPSTNQVTISQTAGSDFVLFNNGDTRMRAVKNAYVEAVGDAFLIAGLNVDIRAPTTQYVTLQQTGVGPQSYFQLTPGGNVVLNARTYFESIAPSGNYFTSPFTELRGYLTFNTANNYLNNVRHIYGDIGGGGGGLAIDYMYGLFFNGTGRNANLYIDAGNLNMINYNSGINIASYNPNGTGNFSLYSASNDMFLGTGTGRDINLNGGRSVSVNAAQPGGAFGIYTSTMNTTTLGEAAVGHSM